TGARQLTGRYLGQSQGRDALRGGEDALYLTRDPRGPSLEDLAPEAFAEILGHTRRIREALREEMQTEFTLEQGKVWILDGLRVARSARAAVAIAVALAEDGIISREEALMRVEPRALNELLHRQVDPDAP
ncbi:MAG: pyruvate, phosphate dikinase, partial [Trueperaceae bacterium]